MNNIEKIIDIMNKKGFKAVYLKDADEAVSYVLSIIAKNDTVGLGGSMTLFETGIADALVSRGNCVYSSELAGRSGGDKEAAKRNGIVITSYSIHYTKLYDASASLLSFCKIIPLIS